jgi:hypothetical protein
MQPTGRAGGRRLSVEPSLSNTSAAQIAIPLQSISYRFKRQHDDGVIRDIPGLAGAVRGCEQSERLVLMKDARYYMTLDVEGYYPWTGWYYTAKTCAPRHPNRCVRTPSRGPAGRSRSP